MYNLLVRNARLLDDSGPPAFKGDIAVEEGRIVTIATSPTPTPGMPSTPRAISPAPVL
ncbi:MAG: N-acyl-D-aspartate/D-glutamate deacylase [Candidatus Latescibacterota bacterium]|jgi:N-acyl-D-aspartate/D-glutamate deacylase